MRGLIRLVLALAVLAGLAIGAVFLLPADRIGALAADQIRAATGRDLTLSGRLRPTLWPEIGVATGPVALSNAAWSEAGPMLRAEGLSVGLDLMALIGGDIVIRQITAQAPEIVLEKAADGRVNWDLGDPHGGGQSGSGAGGPRAFTLDAGRVAAARVTYIDHATGQRVVMSDLDATLTLPDYQGAADLTLTADLNGAPLTAEATVDRFAVMMAGEVAPLRARIGLAGASAAFDGRAGLTPTAVDGALQAAVTDLPALMAALGQPAPDLPAGVGHRLGLSGQLTVAPEGSLHLRQATIRQDQNEVMGAADLFPGDKPRLTGQFRAASLDLAPLTGGDPSGGSGRSGATGWSTDPFDVSALNALDADVTLAADSVDLGKGRLGPTQIRATLDDRRLVVDLQRVQGYGGTVTGTTVVNGRGGLSVRADLRVKGVAMQALLGDLAGYQRLVGEGDLTLSVLGAGASVDAIMNSLSGQGSVSFGKGELLGLDIAGMLRTLDTSYMGAGSKTIFDSITASFTIESGVLKNEDLAFDAPLLQAAGKGRVGLGAKTLKYRVTPTALLGRDGTGGLKVPLLISGSWAQPKFQLDLEAAAKQKLDLDAQKAALEEEARQAAEQAREKLRRKAKESLGVTSEDGESLEGAAKRKLEEEAKRGLRNLLGVK